MQHLQTKSAMANSMDNEIKTETLNPILYITHNPSYNGLLGIALSYSLQALVADTVFHGEPARIVAASWVPQMLGAVS